MPALSPIPFPFRFRPRRHLPGAVLACLFSAAALAATPADGLLVLETADGAVRLAKDGEPWPPPRFVAREAAA